MELRTAYEVLGVNGGDSRAQVWEAYLESRRPAWSLSVSQRRREELDEALNVVENVFAEAAPRPLHADECQHCGWGPAAPVTTTVVTGMLLLFSVRRTWANLCRRCGRAAVGDAQNHCLALGWWAVLGAVVNVFALLRNARQLRAHERRLSPTPVWRRAGLLAAPLPSPRDGVPVWRRPSSWALPAVLVLWTVYAGVANRW